MKHALCSVIFVALIVFNAPAGIQSEQPSGSIKGRITVDGKGQPGVVVSLHMADDYYYYDRRPLATTVTDAEGGYRLTTVAAGRYSVSTHSPLFVNTEIDHNGLVTQGRGIKIEAGENVSDIRIVAAYGIGVVRGQLLVEGLPVDSLKLHVGFRHKNSVRLSGFADIDSRGRFLIEGLPDGDYEVMLMNNPANRDEKIELQSKLQATRQAVTVTNGAEVAVTIRLDLSENKQDR
ncbi:MAG TPA: hypothetical protein VF131_13010 [Blastocatellia bacterium]|nr:hypothetical protein [Blastocatellia bacterium]